MSEMRRRYLGHYSFEGGASIEIVVYGDISTVEALNMAVVLVEMKQREIDNAKDSTEPES